MPDSGDEISSAERFRRSYAKPQSEAERLVELEVFGVFVGTDGYTTPTEADRLVGHLGLDSGSFLLEIGSGRGYPGIYLAKRSGCRAVMTDVPIGSAWESNLNASRAGVGDRSTAASADGKALPFAHWSFDSVVHSDVFC